jgi:hypothetical protein
LAFLATCHEKGVPATLERSRSGNGGHVWIFFSEPVPGSEARKLGAHLVTETMERCPDLGFESYDRFFPSQDTMPAGGFGNLIALPLQNGPRQKGNSVFVDNDLQPYDDQWTFLSSIRRMSRFEVANLVEQASAAGRIVGVRLPLDEDDEEPWLAPPSRRKAERSIVGVKCGSHWSHPRWTQAADRFHRRRDHPKPGEEGRSVRSHGQLWTSRCGRMPPLVRRQL